MKKFKIFDVWLSASLIITFLVYGIIVQNETFMIGYFAVGAWQVISMLVHIYSNCYTIKGGVRYGYHFTVVTILILVLLGFILPVFFIILYILLFAAPFMAMGYTVICYNEVYNKMKRPLDDLK